MDILDKPGIAVDIAGNASHAGRSTGHTVGTNLCPRSMVVANIADTERRPSSRRDHTPVPVCRG